MSDTQAYSISDLEQLSGIPAHTIRTWERRYALLTPVRDSGNARCYDARDVTYLRNLALLLKQGQRISALSRHTREEVAQLAREISPVSTADDITQLLCVALQEFDTTHLEKLMGCSTRKEGFDKALMNHFAPFLDQMSFFVLTGVLESVHVQLFTTILRQKIWAETDQLNPSRDGSRWLLIYTDGDSDSVYRDAMHYLLRKSGHQVITVNAQFVDVINQKIHADGYCFVATGENPGSWLQDTLSKLPALKSQGKTLVLVPGKTLEFVNNLQIQDILVLSGLTEAFKVLIA